MNSANHGCNLLDKANRKELEYKIYDCLLQTQHHAD